MWPLHEEMTKPYFQHLQDYIAAERRTYTVYPPEPDVLAALQTPYDKASVLILGQDPYHGEHQAHGLSFSVPRGVKIPPSLRNIYKELQSDVGVVRSDGCLTDWAAQGVILLNTVLTVRAHQPASHAGIGWEQFTDAIIRTLNAKPHIVCILWGSHAQAKRNRIDARHTIIESVHPSPLSAYRGFFGSAPFSRTNAALRQHGSAEIQW